MRGPGIVFGSNHKGQCLYTLQHQNDYNIGQDCPRCHKQLTKIDFDINTRSSWGQCGQCHLWFYHSKDNRIVYYHLGYDTRQKVYGTKMSILMKGTSDNV